MVLRAASNSAVGGYCENGNWDITGCQEHDDYTKTIPDGPNKKNGKDTIRTQQYRQQAYLYCCFSGYK